MADKPEVFIGPYRHIVVTRDGSALPASDFERFDALSPADREACRRREELRCAFDQRAARDAVLRQLDAKEKADARGKKMALRRRKVPKAAEL